MRSEEAVSKKINLPIHFYPAITYCAGRYCNSAMSQQQSLAHLQNNKEETYQIRSSVAAAIAARIPPR